MSSLADTIDAAMKPYINSVWRQMLVPEIARAVQLELSQKLSDPSEMVMTRKEIDTWSPCA